MANKSLNADGTAEVVTLKSLGAPVAVPPVSSIRYASLRAGYQHQLIMNTTSQDIRSSLPQHPYPLVRSGGLFLVFIGAGIIGAVFLSGAAFIVSTVFAIMSLMFSKVLSFGKPTRIQIIALVLAIALEIVLITIMVHALPADVAGSVRLIWILMIVGVHFLPMAISFGPRFGALGALCIVNALAGLVLTGAASEIFLLLDGALKVVFGIWLFSEKARAA